MGTARFHRGLATLPAPLPMTECRWATLTATGRMTLSSQTRIPLTTLQWCFLATETALLRLAHHLGQPSIMARSLFQTSTTTGNLTLSASIALPGSLRSFLEMEMAHSQLEVRMHPAQIQRT